MKFKYSNMLTIEWMDGTRLMATEMIDSIDGFDGFTTSVMITKTFSSPPARLTDSPWQSRSMTFTVRAYPTG